MKMTRQSIYISCIAGYNKAPAEWSYLKVQEKEIYITPLLSYNSKHKINEKNKTL